MYKARVAEMMLNYQDEYLDPLTKIYLSTETIDQGQHTIKLKKRTGKK